MSERIRITNISNHIHAVRLLNPNTGTFFHRPLNPKQFMTIDQDQFLDLYNSTVDFESGILGFDVKTLPQDIADVLGFESKEDMDVGIVGYSDKQIQTILTGKIGEFKAFMKEVRELPIGTKTEFSKRLFAIAEKMSDEITQGKAKEIEEATGLNFELELEFKNSK